MKKLLERGDTIDPLRLPLDNGFVAFLLLRAEKQINSSLGGFRMKHFRKALMVFFCMAFIFSTCVIPSSAQCDCGEEYYMYDTFYYRSYLNNDPTYCYIEYPFLMAFCRNCGDQWMVDDDDLLPISVEHNFVCGRCDECGYLQ